MRLIRRLAYRLGFRPRPGTILYSPSFFDRKAYRRAFEAAVKAYEQPRKLVVIPTEWSVEEIEMRDTQDLKDAVATVRAALVNYQESEQKSGPIDSPYGQLVMAVEYLTLKAGHILDETYAAIKLQGESQLPLNTDGDRIWHEDGM